jgi:hypothetical protein
MMIKYTQNCVLQFVPNKIAVKRESGGSMLSQPIAVTLDQLKIVVNEVSALKLIAEKWFVGFALSASILADEGHAEKLMRTKVAEGSKQAQELLGTLIGRYGFIRWSIQKELRNYLKGRAKDSLLAIKLLNLDADLKVVRVPTAKRSIEKMQGLLNEKTLDLAVISQLYSEIGATINQLMAEQQRRTQARLRGKSQVVHHSNAA